MAETEGKPDPLDALFQRDLTDAEMEELEARIEASQHDALKLIENARKAYAQTGLPEPEWRPKARFRPFVRWAWSMAALMLAVGIVWLLNPHSRPLPHPEAERAAVPLTRGAGPRFLVSLGGKPVLEMKRGPGLLLSEALLPAGQAPKRHPFVDARALDALSEDALYRILAASKDFDDFVRRLKSAGYKIESR